MPHINEMKGPSKYLSKEDVGRGALVTVKGIEQRNVAREGDSPEFRWLMHFMEGNKPLVLNSTNIQLTARICGSENTDDWTGKQLVLYTDPNVSYAGKLVGGIRIRAPKPQAVAPATQVQQNTIEAAAARWTQGHAMPAAIAPATADEIFDPGFVDEPPF